MEYLLLTLGVIAAGELIYCIWLRAKIEKLNDRLKARFETIGGLSRTNSAYAQTLRDFSAENTRLKTKLSRSYHSQFRVNGRFAKRPDPIVDEARRRAAQQAYGARTAKQDGEA